MGNPLHPDPVEAQDEWARRVRANRSQVDRFRELPEDADFYAPVADRFRDDPRRQGDPVVERLHELARPDETWLDVGAGGGRYALPLALAVREVIALDPSRGMLNVVRESLAEHRIGNVRIVEARWPDPRVPREQVRADTALIANVGYDIEEIGPFLDGLEAAAPRVIAVLAQRQPAADAYQFWEIHGEPRVALPGLPELLTLLLARDRLAEVRLVPRTRPSFASPEEALGLVRRQLWLQPDGAKDRQLAELIRERLREHDGRLTFDASPTYLGVVSWTSR